jgi:hypothetical protein
VRDNQYVWVFCRKFFNWIRILISEDPFCEASSLFLTEKVWSLQKPNSWTYYFVEVSGHNLESSQTWGFCTDILNHREVGMVFYHISPLQWQNTENFSSLLLLTVTSTNGIFIPPCKQTHPITWGRPLNNFATLLRSIRKKLRKLTKCSILLHRKLHTR